MHMANKINLLQMINFFLLIHMLTLHDLFYEFDEHIFADRQS